MNRKIKRLLGLAIVLVMALAVMSVSAFAADDVAAIGDTTYATLAEAIAAAVKGDTITLLDDVNENVTINKNLTLDGAGYAYTGTMTANAGLTVTVKNVNFVNGGIAKTSKTSTGTYTITDCTFDGEGKYAYPLMFKGAKNITVDNCNVKNYLYSFLYVTSATNKVSVNNVTVEDCPSYAVYFASGVTTANFENLTVKNSSNGFVINNTANRAFTIKNCNMENVGTAINHANGTKTVTCTALGMNDFGGAVISQYVNIAGAQVGNVYGSLKAVVDAAKDGDTVTVLGDMTVADSEAYIESVYNKYYVFAEVTDKNVTIDLNGKVITINPDLDKMLIAVLYSAKDGEITLKDSSEVQSGAINVTASEASSVYSMFTADEGGKFNIESGNYYLNRVDLSAGAPRSLIYASDDMHFTVTGGDFVLGNAHTSTDINGGPQPWIFNGYKNRVNRIYVTGGTYNVDPTHSYGEAYFPYCYKVVAADDKYSVVYAPAAVIGDEGYETLREAVDAAVKGDVITICSDITLDNAEAEIAAYDMYSYISVTDKKLTIDLNGKTITANPEFDKPMYGIIVVSGKGNVTLMDSSADQSGAINVTMAEDTQAYSMFSTDGAKSKLTINGGNYYIDRIDKGYSMLYIAQTGTGYVNGGNFVLGNAKTVIREGVPAPWIFNTYANGKNFVYVTGGTYNTNPEHHWDEVVLRNGYETIANEDGSYSIVFNPVKVQPADVEAAYGEDVAVKVEAEGEGLKYKWYICDEGKTKFSASSISADTYTAVMSAARAGRKIYCKITDKYGNSAVTDVVTLTYKAPQLITNNDLLRDVYTYAKGEDVAVKVEAEGEGLTYQWYIKNSGSTKFSKSSLTADTYTAVMSAARSGRTIYCVVTDKYGNVDMSKEILINMA